MLSEALRLIRVFHDMKQTELANHLGLSPSYISEIESGRKVPTIDIINKYASEFSIPASSILFFSEELIDPAEKPIDERVRGAIASKVVNFLKLIEHKASNDA